MLEFWNTLLIMKTIRVAGFDPSLSNWGMCIAEISDNGIRICETGIVQPTKEANNKTVRKNSDDLRRGRELVAGVTEFINSWNPYLIMVEIPHGSQSSRAMVSYALCIGILATIKIPLIEITAIEVKIASVGSKTATKAEMIDWGISKYEPLKSMPKSKSEHIADSIAAVYAGIKTEQFKGLMALIK